MSATGSVEVNVVVDDRHLTRLEEVADRLRAAGFTVTGTQSALGTITGSVDPSAIEALRATEGVAGVEVNREIRLPPPDAPIQ